jgi:hypothetical protein
MGHMNLPRVMKLITIDLLILSDLESTSTDVANAGEEHSSTVDLFLESAPKSADPFPPSHVDICWTSWYNDTTLDQEASSGRTGKLI